MASCFDVGAWGPGVFGVAKSVQEISFGGILGDFCGTCLTLGIHVSADTTADFKGMELPCNETKFSNIMSQSIPTGYILPKATPGD